MIKNLLIVALLFVSTIAFAQPGSIDTTFNTFDDGTLGDGRGFDGTVYSISTQADGKIIVGGNFSSFNGTSGINRIIRLNADGRRDTTFRTDAGLVNIVYSTSIQADGKVIVGGDFSYFNGTTEINNIVRLHADGSRDTSFNTGTGFSNRVYSTSILADGKIIVVGSFHSFNGITGINGIVRLNANGTVDATFNAGSGFNDHVYSSSIQPDGKIIVGGEFTSFNGTTGINRIVRLNADGSLDATFNTGLGFSSPVRSTSIQADGKIIVVGDFRSFDGTNNIVRLNANGTVDATFDTGTGFNNSVNSSFIQADGKIIVGGAFSAFNGITGISNIVRLNANGTRDTTFNPGRGFNNSVIFFSTQADGKIIVVGDFTSFNGIEEINRIARLHANGSRDTTFNTLPGFNNSVIFFSTQADGKIIVGGAFGSFNGIGINRIVRLNANGTRDTTFNIGSGFNDIVNSSSIQADGKIILGGWFTSFNGINGINRIVRLHTNGSLDTTFKTAAGFNHIVNSTSIQADGKIVVGGFFTSFNGTTGINRIVRLNANGTRDTTFNTGTGINDRVFLTSIQSDGKIIVGGDFTSFNGTTGINDIVRLHANGSRDTTFNSGAGFNSFVLSTSIQADGKIIVGGDFTSFNGTTRINPIVRLNANGTRDTTFYSGAELGGTVYSSSIQSDGKIIVGGRFTSFYGTPRINNIVRLNTNGMRDATFNTGTGFNGGVYSTSIQSDGKIIAGGGFTSFNGKGKNGLARLLGGCAPTSSLQNVTVCDLYKWLANGITYTSSGKYTAKLSNAAGCDSIITLNLTISKIPVLTTSVNGITITANETGATYQWIDCNNANAPIAGKTNQSYTATANGSYAVIVTKNTCSDTSACVKITTIGISPIVSQTTQVIIYPNPNNGAFTMSATSEGVYTIQNGLGQIIQSVKLNAANNYTMNIENLSNGIYFVTGYNNNMITQQKVVVSK